MRNFILIFVMTLLMTGISFAAIEIKGLIKQGTISLPFNLLTDDGPFPTLHYDINDLLVGRLDAPITFYSGLKINSDNYRLIDVLGSLDLVSYDQTTGYYKYKLTIKARKLLDVSIHTSAYKPIPIDSKLLFNINQTPEIFIEGQAKYVNNKLILNNINADQSGFSLTFGIPEPNRLALTAIRDIPITMYSND